VGRENPTTKTSREGGKRESEKHTQSKEKTISGGAIQIWPLMGRKGAGVRKKEAPP